MSDLLRKLGFPLPEAVSTYAPRIDVAMSIVHIGMAVIFVAWSILFIYVLIRFRRGANPQADHNVHKWEIGSLLPDIAVLVFEIWLIFSLGLPTWGQIKEKFPNPQDSVQIHLVAQQFMWNFHYPGPDGIFGRRDATLVNSGSNPIGLDSTDPAAKDDLISRNQLYVPLGKPTIITMTSLDVIHSFFIPEFRSKQDIVPGMSIPIWFEPTKTGSLQVVCSQLCGNGHYRMVGQVEILSLADYDAKLKSLAAEAAAAAR